ncbi:MAG: molybdenum cofactor biosynthesis protein [Candidatus Binatia bacterium]|nr:MAG: molybdenum cofactor biosynthesis protein [Candidatus Binatia bacterium]
MREKTAALVVIGNEILSGKVVDTNSSFLAQELRKLGVALRRITVVPDEPEEIAEAIRAVYRTHDVVFTSGGVGPTHDDVTIEGIARGLGRKVVRHPEMERMLREFFGEKVNDARLKMAEIPEGAELLFDGGMNFPTLVVENIYILPGIPELFRAKFLAIKDRFAVDPYYMRVVYTGEPESSIAEALNATQAAFPELLLGSYPKLDADYRVRITLESKDPEYLERAFRHLLETLPPGSVLRTE